MTCQPTSDDKLTSENSALLNREQAAELVTREFFPCTTGTIASWAVSYRRLGRWALYEPEDIRAEAQRRLDAAPVLAGGAA